jgi:hypothetical protein
MVEIKIRTNLRLKNRIKMLANERGISLNKMIIYLLEIALYKLLEEEDKYGKIEFKQINRK